MKSLLLGIVLIVVIGVGGLVYRNAIEYARRPVACPQFERACPDGTHVSRIGNTCDFPACPFPNVSLSEVGLTFALPQGFSSTTPSDAASVAAYRLPGPTSLEPSEIIIRRYAIAASSGSTSSPQATALAVIQATAIGGASGMPVPVTHYSSMNINNRQFTAVSIERFEAVITTAYYLARPTDVLRFDAIDRGVPGWMEPTLDISTLPAHRALRELLSTLQAG